MVDYMKKLFELQTDLTSFTYPIVKIIICWTVCILCFFRDRIYRFSNNAIDVLICLLLILPSILCFYISVGEIFHTAANRKRAKHKITNRKSSKIKQMTIETITKIVSENDIVEIDVCKDKSVIKIGASAVCEYTSYVFTDKLFYISSSEYESIEQFVNALLKLFPEGSVPVLKIDGLPPDLIRL